MSLVYRGINISQNEDHILSIILALSTVQLQSEIWYPYANVFFQRISFQPLEANSHSSEGQRHQVFIVFSSAVQSISMSTLICRHFFVFIFSVCSIQHTYLSCLERNFVTNTFLLPKNLHKSYKLFTAFSLPILGVVFPRLIPRKIP